ncbi:MAG: nucleotidyltransferase domain-containing protein [Anaerolineae bacterium]|nr:nucleotidyltransferase domain-containing protein [Anaerolineae bacterium]
MTRTALDLSTQEWQAYRPGSLAGSQPIPQTPTADRRRRQAWRVARRAAQLLRERYGASKVVLFGSLTHDAWFTSRSDIDLAAWGIPPECFYSAVATVTGLSATFKIDLVDGDACRSSLRTTIEREGIEL